MSSLQRGTDNQRLGGLRPRGPLLSAGTGEREELPGGAKKTQTVKGSTRYVGFFLTLKGRLRGQVPMTLLAVPNYSFVTVTMTS